MWYKNIAGRFFGLVTKYGCDRQTDRRPDGQTDSQDRASMRRAAREVKFAREKNYNRHTR